MAKLEGAYAFVDFDRYEKFDWTNKDGITKPIESLVVDMEEQFQGGVMGRLGERKALLQNMEPDGKGRTRLEFIIPARGLIGFQGEFMTLTRGTGIMSHVFDEYAPAKAEQMAERRNGVLISQDDGAIVAYAIWKLQERGRMFVSPGEPVYEGMIVGENPRTDDLPVNPTRSKALTNFREVMAQNMTLTVGINVIFAAIIIHEFGHAAMAAALKIPSRRIVLTFFGGYVEFVRQPQHGWQEIAVSAAGPGANLASYALVASLLPLLAPATAPGDVGFLNALNTFGVISLLLGLFNLLPGFPLDGGHILRAALGYIMKRNTARILTAITGLLLAAALIAYAIWQSLLWTGFIAAMLGLAAWAELRAARYDRQRADSDTTSNA